MTEKIIKSGPSTLSAHLSAIYAYRHLVKVFAVREIKNKYAQTFMGLLWAIFQPFITLIVFAFFFGVLLKVNTSPIPYPVFVFSGLIFWYNFSSIANSSGMALIQSQEFINKIYFPKLILLFSKALSAFTEFVLSFILLFILILIYKVPLSFRILYFPVFIIYNAVIALSIGVWLSSLTIRYRDLQHIIPYLIGFGVFVTPVFFPATLIPANYHFLIYLNPIAGVVEGARWSLGCGAFPGFNYLWGLLPVALLLTSGLFYFFSVEDNLADII